jgi:hypothetical protein
VKIVGIASHKVLTPQHYILHQQEEEDQLQWKLKRQKTIQKRQAEEEKQSKVALHV